MRTMAVSKRLGVLIAMALALVSAPMASPASAAPVAAALRGTVRYVPGTCGTGSMSGSAVATSHGTAAPVSPLGTFSATFSYCEPLIVTGTASGTFTLSAAGVPTHSCGFAWTRLGQTVIVSFSGGSCSLGSIGVLHFGPAPLAGGVLVAGWIVLNH